MIAKRKCLIFFSFLITFIFLIFSQSTFVVNADALTDGIDEQLKNLDLKELETFFNSLNLGGLIDFNTIITGLLKGEYDFDYNSLFSYLASVLFSDIIKLIPTFISIIAISIFCLIVQNLKSSCLSDSVAEIIFFVCICAVISLVLSHVLSITKNVKIVIENIANLTEIMSPIIITLMVAVGGNVSASVYKPSVAFLSSGIINVFMYAVIPLISFMTIFNIANNFSSSIKLGKFSDFFASTIKWIIGIVITIFTMFLSVQGITSASFDGVSVKAAKYAISNSIPLVGGFLKDGFDLVVAGSVLIKQSVGFAVLFALFILVFSPIINMVAFSLLLKLVSSIIEPISDVRISNFCMGLSKTVSYLIASILSVGFMVFITVLLMIFSANAFI